MVVGSAFDAAHLASKWGLQKLGTKQIQQALAGSRRPRRGQYQMSDSNCLLQSLILGLRLESAALPHSRALRKLGCSFHFRRTAPVWSGSSSAICQVDERTRRKVCDDDARITSRELVPSTPRTVKDLFSSDSHRSPQISKSFRAFPS